MTQSFTRRGMAAVALAALAACSDTVMPPREAASEARAARAAGASPAGRYIVVFRASVTDPPGLARREVARLGGTIHYTYKHVLKGFAATLPAGAVDALRSNPDVEFVQPDGVARPSATQFNAPWALDRIDQRTRPLNSEYTYTQTGVGVNLYVVDSGMNVASSEFGGRAVFAYDAFGGTGYDCADHGTQVAGIAGGATWGVAKGVTLHNVKVLGCGVGDSSPIVAGLEWVAANHVKPAVANLSLDSGVDSTVYRAARGLVAAGVTVVAAAGNSPISACDISPARVPEVLTVGAARQNLDTPLPGYPYGSCIDLYAPGENVTGPLRDGGFISLPGTSVAAPQAAGVAAQYLQANPTASPAQVNAAVLLAATPGVMTGLAPGSPNLMLYSRQTQTYRRIQNRWQSSKYIHTEGGLQASGMLPGWWSAQWQMEPVAGTHYYRIKNRYTGYYLNAESPTLQAGNILPGWHSAMWELENVEGFFRIKNRYRGTYLHVEYGSLQLGAIHPSWLSAQWTFEDTGIATP